MKDEIIKKYIKAGQIAAEALDFGRKLIRKGSSLVSVAEDTERKIFELGSKPAFPVQISLNHIAAHYCPDADDKTLFSEELVNIDVGVHLDGYIGDTACSIDLSGKNEKLVVASRESLENVLSILKVGTTLGEIGKKIQETISKYGLSPVKNLSGHGLSRFMQHDKPSIPNFDTNDKTTIQSGMVFAIEPFASNGSGIVQDSGDASVFMLAQKKNVRSNITREILREIENYQGLPFCRRWLYKKFGNKTNFALRELLQSGIIKPYPPLADSSKGLVSQAEHTVLIDSNNEVIVTTKLKA